MHRNRSNSNKNSDRNHHQSISKTKIRDGYDNTPSVAMSAEFETNDILSNFPKIELSYETVVHKKVQSDYISAIPFGKKTFAWFTTFNDKDVCFLLNPTINSQIAQALTSFESSLCSGDVGTIVYGSIVNSSLNNFFVIEDIFYHKGRNVCGESHINKLTLLKNIITHDLGEYAFNKNCLMFGLPVIHNNFKQMMQIIATLPYKIAFIKFNNFRNNKQLSISFFKAINDTNETEISAGSSAIAIASNTEANTITSKDIKGRTKTFKQPNTTHQSKIFIVEPQFQPDIYYLYSPTTTTTDSNLNKPPPPHEIAYIPNYSASVMMNNLFRNIKENRNLDALEESDDDEDFEDSNVDKYVLNRKYQMHCVYNNRFKKWVPQKIVENSN